MKELLLAVSFLALENHSAFQPTDLQIKNQWLGFEPATTTEIIQKEKELGVKFPEDYIEFLQNTNGFLSTDESTEPTFLNVKDVDYLKNIDPFLIECYNFPELQNAIFIAGKDEEQYFLLIPPSENGHKWRYWKFANWIPGEHEFENMEDYFKWNKTMLEKELNK